jgi:acetyl-CoA acetyltransferase
MTQFGGNTKPLEKLFADATLSTIHDVGVEGNEIEPLYFSDEQPTSPTFLGVFALPTKRHMHVHGITEEQLAEVAVKNHAHGQYNPRAHFGREADVAEVIDNLNHE